MAAPAQNQNAAKPEAEKATSILQVRCLPRDKAGWVKAARGRDLSSWVIDVLNHAAGSRRRDS